MGLFGSRIANAFYEKGLRASYTQNENNTQTVTITAKYKETRLVGDVYDGTATFVITQCTEETYGYFETPQVFEVTLAGPYENVVIVEVKNIVDNEEVESLHTSTVIRGSGETMTFNNRITKEEVTYKDVIEELTATWRKRNIISHENPISN